MVYYVLFRLREHLPIFWPYSNGIVFLYLGITVRMSECETQNKNFRHRIFLLLFQLGGLIPYLFTIVIFYGVFYILIHPLIQSLNNINRPAIR